MLAASVFGFTVPADAATLGLITGITYGLLSVGLVIVYRTNRIINFAHGEIGAFGVTVFGLLVSRGHVPYYVTLPIALAVGAGVAALAELAVIRRLRSAPPLMSVVATLGVGQLLRTTAQAIYAQAGSGYAFPEPPGLPSWNIGALHVTRAYTGILFFAPVVVLALAAFLRRSRFGLALRSAAANPEAARMSGVFASRMSSLAWALAGAFSTFTAILVIPTTGTLSLGAFGPGLLLRAMVGAVIGRMTNLPMAMAGGMALGLVQGLLLRNYPRGGLVELVLFAVVLVGLLIQARERGREQERGSAWAAVQPWRALPEAVARLRSVRALGPGLAVVTLTALLSLPLWVNNRHAITVTSIMGITIVAFSVSIVTGLAGQLTLGQFALGGVGAVVSAHLAAATGGRFALVLPLLGGGVAAALASLVISLPALRIRGLFLTVTTLSFAIVMPAWVLQQRWALGDSRVPGRPVVFGKVLSTGRAYYYFMLAVFVVMFLFAWSIRRSGFGRLLVAVRDGEDTARSFTVAVPLVKLQGFLLAGFVAGVGGAAYAHTFSRIQPDQTFLTQFSIDVVVMTVVGGVATLSGPILGALLVKVWPAFAPLDNAGVAATNLGLLLIILYVPGGIAQAVRPVRDRVVGLLARRHGLSIGDGIHDADAAGAGADQRVSEFHVRATGTQVRDDGGGTPAAVLEVDGVEKHFGGLIAVHDVSLRVNPGETLGIIGPNGAGKTTLFEVLGGFTRPDGGRIVLDGHDITRLSPEARGRLGLIRSFQDAALFPTMTVLETVQVALERTMPTRVTAVFVGGRGASRIKEQRARDLVGSMGLWPYRNKAIRELSTGTRRITELACMIALRPRLLLLDEPSSGIAQRESEALGILLVQLKDALGMTMVVIEHDIPLIMSISDRLLAMDAGAVIATGSPDEVRNDAAVIEAYLGGRLDAIERSGLVTAVAGGSQPGGAVTGPAVRRRRGRPPDR